MHDMGQALRATRVERRAERDRCHAVVLQCSMFCYATYLPEREAIYVRMLG